MGCNQPFVEGRTFHSPLRNDDVHKSCTFSRDRKGLFKFHDHNYPGLYFTPAHVWASHISRRPIDELYGLERVTLACWKIRLLIRLGRLQAPALELPLLLADPPRSARAAYQGFGVLLQCRMAYNRSSKPEPAPFSYRFAEDWVPMTSRKAAQYGITWLLQNGALRCDGRQCGLNLYWPSAW